jgi:hypothetical protein
MSLDDLNKEIYNSQSKIISSHTHESSEYDPNVSTAIPSPFDKEEIWKKEKASERAKKKKMIIYIVSAILTLIVLAIAGFYAYRWWQKDSFHQDRVEISFEGPTEADSTQATKYTIHYKNNNRVTLKNAEIQFVYTENFQPIDNVNLKYLSPSASKIFVGDVKPNSEGEVELNGNFYAPKDTPVYLYASIHFVPSNGSSELSVDGQIGVNITSAPVVLNITAPQQAVNGDKVQYVVDYSNLDVKKMNDVQVRIDFPQGFTMIEAQPSPSEKDSYWYVGNLDPQQDGKITINGQLYGDVGQNENATVSIGYVGSDGKFVVFNKYDFGTQIISPILTVKQTLQNKDNNIISAGDVLTDIIDFKNTGGIGLRDNIVSVQLNGKILDFSKINTDKGSFDEKTGIITWKTSEVPSLANIAANDGGSVQFSIPVKSIIPVESNSDKNFVVSSIASIDSPDIPISNGSNKIIGKDELDLKLASKVIFDTKGYYTDAKIKNSGPIPMQVGTETSFAIHWDITTVSNDISGAKVVSSLPSGVRWIGQIYPTDEKITYDERTGQVIWDAGDVAAGTGITGSPREVVFQVAVTPQSNQVGEPITLVNQSTLTATDTFVNQDLSQDNGAKDTQLSEDSTVGYAKSKVVAVP